MPTIMTRCKYIFCGEWFEAKESREKFCSVECGRRHHNDLRTKKKFPKGHRCKVCGRFFQFLRKNWGTCGRQECLDALEEKRKTKRRSYHAGEPKPLQKFIRMGRKVLDITDHAGYCECLDCGRNIWTPDKRKHRHCPQCERHKDLKRHINRFVPEGW